MDWTTKKPGTILFSEEIALAVPLFHHPAIFNDEKFYKRCIISVQAIIENISTRTGGGTAHTSPGHRQADEFPDAEKPDGLGGNGIVYKSYGMATVRYPVLEVTATVEAFENMRGFTLRVLRVGKPRMTS